MRIVYKLLTFLGVFTLGAISPWLWSVVFTDDAAFPFKIQFVVDPVDRLLLPHEERVEILPHMVIPDALESEPAPEPFETYTNYRRTLHWNAVTELYGYSRHSNDMDAQFLDSDIATYRHAMTCMQIQQIQPSFLPYYQAMYAALTDMDEILCEMRVANRGERAPEAYPNLAPMADLLARLAHYQMAKGGRGGDFALDFHAFDKSISLVSGSSFSHRRADYPACRKRLIEVVRRIDGLLVEWNPTCARLIAEHVIGLTEDFQPLPR